MTGASHLTFYLHDQLRKRAEAGNHNFISLICDVVEQAGWTVDFSDSSKSSRLKSAVRPGHALFLMHEPFHSRSLTMRRVYEYPFWAIESSAKRWLWPVAQTAFEGAAAPAHEVDGFFRFWRKRMFGDAAENTGKDGFVYVPLQGLLLEHRSFQCAAPLEMLKQVLMHDRERRVIATLHPKETYSAAERNALDLLVQQTPRLDIRVGGMAQLLARCDYVVTQNSSAAFFGYFFQKPAVLFGQIDFHHIASNVLPPGAEAALAQAPCHEPDFAGYLHWFWQEQSINAGRETAPDRIRQRLINAGWPL